MKYYKYLVWKGVVTKTECKEHSYKWNGAMPCTGVRVCVFCGKREGLAEPKTAHKGKGGMLWSTDARSYH